MISFLLASGKNALSVEDNNPVIIRQTHENSVQAKLSEGTLEKIRAEQKRKSMAVKWVLNSVKIWSI